MLAVLANEMSAIIQFRLTEFLCYISPEERVAVEVKNDTRYSALVFFDKDDDLFCNKALNTSFFPRYFFLTTSCHSKWLLSKAFNS